MLYALRYHSQFDASHRVSVSGHDRPHGHTFRVSAEIRGDLLAVDDPEYSETRRVARSEGMQEKLDAITAELDLRDLNVMMTGSVTTPETIAAWILERLPDVDVVEVEMGWRRETGWAQRTRR